MCRGNFGRFLFLSDVNHTRLRTTNQKIYEISWRGATESRRSSFFLSASLEFDLKLSELSSNETNFTLRFDKYFSYDFSRRSFVLKAARFYFDPRNLKQDRRKKDRLDYKLNNRLYLVKHLQGNKTFFLFI